MDPKKKKILAGIAVLFFIVISASFLMPKGDEAEYDSDDDTGDEGDDEGDAEGDAEGEDEGDDEETESEPQPIEETPANKKNAVSEPAPVEKKADTTLTFTVPATNRVHPGQHHQPLTALEEDISGLDGYDSIEMNIVGKVKDQGGGGECASIEVVVDDDSVFKSGPNGWWGDWGSKSFRSQVNLSETFTLDPKHKDPKKIMVKIHTYGTNCALNVTDMVIKMTGKN